jgi:hypothetical protein
MKIALWALLAALSGPSMAQTPPAANALPSAAAQTTSPQTTSAQTSAQTSDWDLRRDDRAKLTVAFVAFDNGLAIGARCTEGGYQFAISGLPPVTTDTRPLRIGFNGAAPEVQTWYVATSKATAISSFPAPFARQLRLGGRLDIVVPGGAANGGNLRYVVTLPASGSAIETTLDACSRSLVDPRDSHIEIGENGLPEGVDWTTPPRLQYPATATGNGFATLTCLTQADGRVRDCVVEAEYPASAGFGRAALRAMGRARLGNAANPDRPLPVQMISFTTSFCLDGYCPGQRPTLPTGSRLPVTSPDG